MKAKTKKLLTVISITAVLFITALVFTNPSINQYGIQLNFIDGTGYWLEF